MAHLYHHGKAQHCHSNGRWFGHGRCWIFGKWYNWYSELRSTCTKWGYSESTFGPGLSLYTIKVNNVKMLNIKINSDTVIFELWARHQILLELIVSCHTSLYFSQSTDILWLITFSQDGSLTFLCSLWGCVGGPDPMPWNATKTW